MSQPTPRAQFRAFLTKRRATLARAALLYAEQFRLPDSRIPATFEILFLTGWAPGALNAEYGTGAATGRPNR